MAFSVASASSNPHLAVYLRVSTRKQAQPYPGVPEAHTSLSTQRNLIFAYLEGKVYIPEGVFEAPGKRASLEKPESTLWFLVTTKRNTGIVVYDASRLCRNVKQFDALLAEARKNGNWFVSVSDRVDTLSEEGLNTFYQKVVLAEGESKMISLRAKSRVQSVRALGGHIGPAPYGMQKVQNPTTKLFSLVQHPEEQATIQRITNFHFDFSMVPDCREKCIFEAVNLLLTPGSSMERIQHLLRMAGATEDFWLEARNDGFVEVVTTVVPDASFGRLSYGLIRKELERIGLDVGSVQTFLKNFVQNQKLGYIASMLNAENSRYRVNSRYVVWTPKLVKKLLKKFGPEMGRQVQMDGVADVFAKINLSQSGTGSDYMTVDGVMSMDSASASGFAPGPVKKTRRGRQAKTVPVAPVQKGRKRRGSTSGSASPFMPKAKALRVIPGLSRVAPPPMPASVSDFERVWYQPGMVLPGGIPPPSQAGWVSIPRMFLS